LVAIRRLRTRAFLSPLDSRGLVERLLPHDVFVYVDADGQRELLGDPGTTSPRVPGLGGDDGRDQPGARTARSLATARRLAKEPPVLAAHQRPVPAEEGGRLARRGLRSSGQSLEDPNERSH
jgi:hypothetical protein